MKIKFEKQINADFTNLQNELKDKDQKLKESRKKELELIRQQKELEEKKKLFELDFEKKIGQERKKLEKEYNKLKDQFSEQQEQLEKEYEFKLKDFKKKIEDNLKKKIEDNLSIELQDLRLQLKEQDEIIKNSQKKELEFIKSKRELDQKKKNFELEITKKMEEERNILEEEISKRITEEYRFKEAEKEKQISGMIKQIEELKRKAEQGSQQLQGEVLEIELEDMLRVSFPKDIIEPVTKGVKGADIIQKIYDSYGRFCGTIIWESKRTKNWSDSWIDKLKEDQREKAAELAVLMTTTLPKNINNFGFVSEIWVTNIDCTIALATALRLNLIELHNIKLASTGKNEKMELLYNYLSSKEFKQKIEAIIEAFTTMKAELYIEKKAIMKIWAKREKQIERVFNSTVKMYGNMEGIIGNSMPAIESFELKTLSTEINNFEENNDGNNILENHKNEDFYNHEKDIVNTESISPDKILDYKYFINAAVYGDLEKIQKCIDDGYDVDYKDTIGSTALIYAVAFGHSSVIKILLSNGADKEIKDDQGMCALDYAHEKGNPEIIKLLN
ncbi:MAG: DUF2130 domain-containing protein [Bacteroidales bacterium]|nr:DUF2130 domain-containing protein [Bacteroidales bacterium]